MPQRIRPNIIEREKGLARVGSFTIEINQIKRGPKTLRASVDKSERLIIHDEKNDYSLIYRFPLGSSSLNLI